MSQYHFSRLFHRVVGVTFQHHLVTLRLHEAEQAIKRDPFAPLVRVAAQTGFGTLRNLEEHHRRIYGYPPSQRRAKAPPDTARWGDEQDPPLVERDSARTATPGSANRRVTPCRGAAFALAHWRSLGPCSAEDAGCVMIGGRTRSVTNCRRPQPEAAVAPRLS
jgi:AraC-like DNA-binding protein